MSAPELVRDLERCARLRAAMPPADLRSVEVSAEEQLDLTLELLQRAAERRGSAPTAVGVSARVALSVPVLALVVWLLAVWAPSIAMGAMLMFASWGT